MLDWHFLDTGEALAKTSSNIEGLSEGEAVARLKQYGFNELREKKKKGLLAMLFEQITDFIVLILIAATVISIFLGEIKDAVVILLIIFLNAALGIFQQERASKAIEALRKMTVPKVMVKRDGELRKISVKELVPGDILFLETGGVVGADARLIEAVNLRTSEAPLTGESTPVEKTSDRLNRQDIPVADMVNMVFMGTTVTYGRGAAVVVATGMATQIGHIAEMVQEDVEVETPLEKRLDVFGKWLGTACLAICALVFVLAVLEGGDLFDDFLTAVSLAVAAIPEGLPAVTTISLALGAYRMSRRGAIIRKLPAVETLGSVSVICSDKTGTLTQNKMTVNTMYYEGRTIEVTGTGYEPSGKFTLDGRDMDPRTDKILEQLLYASALCNDSHLEHFRETNRWDVIGDPTEGALTVLAAKAGITRALLEKELPRVAEIPFDSKRKLMTTIHRSGADASIIYVKGAPDELLKICRGADRDRLLKENEKLAGKGLRTLGFAYKEVKGEYKLEEAESGLIFLGIVGMMDLPRPEVKDAVHKCREAGIEPIMITGDHKLTAQAVADQLGIEKVYARISPEEKLRIVEDLQSKGNVVAVTGDGVNDAPALKRADIGIAMGITGTDVSKEASDMVLVDDNFATIVAAVEEGRGIFENIRKFVWYLLSANVGEICTMFFAILLRMPLPLLPIHILWVNLVTDGLPALALSAEPIEKDVMKRPPRKKSEGIINSNIVTSMLFIGVLMGIVSLFLFNLGAEESLAKGRTMAFSALALLEMFHVFNCKSENRSLFKVGIFSNIYLVLAVASTVLIQMLVIYVPQLQKIFNTVALSGSDLIWLFALSSLPVWVVEMKKRFFKVT